MKNKTICLPDDIFLRLSNEKNASELITKLLSEHFRGIENKKKTVEEIDKEIKDYKEQLQKELKILEEQGP